MLFTSQLRLTLSVCTMLMATWAPLLQAQSIESVVEHRYAENDGVRLHYGCAGSMILAWLAGQAN